jgi:hypothetical protein
LLRIDELTPFVKMRIGEPNVNSSNRAMEDNYRVWWVSFFRKTNSAMGPQRLGGCACMKKAPSATDAYAISKLISMPISRLRLPGRRQPRTGVLTDKAMHRMEAYRMIQRPRSGCI